MVPQVSSIARTTALRFTLRCRFQFSLTYLPGRFGNLSVLLKRHSSEWITDMRCPGCGAEMHLIEAAPDKTKMVPGYEQHTFECSSCHDHVRQLVFTPRAIEPLSSEETRLSAAWLETLNKHVA